MKGAAEEQDEAGPNVKARYLKLAGAGVVNFGAFLLCYYGPTLPSRPFGFFRDMSILLAAVPFGGLVVTFVGLKEFVSGKGRRESAFLAVLGAFLLASSCGGMAAGQRLRSKAFRQLAERAGPLVAAIKAHELKMGYPPAALQDLVPAFLASVPVTGMGSYPTYEYFSGAEAKQHEGNPWVLVVPCGGPGFNFDQFLYFPLQNYPQRGYGGALERMADWAYVHE
jgi:hypothetical protein